MVQDYKDHKDFNIKMDEKESVVVKMLTLTGRKIEVEMKKTGKIQDVKEYIYKNTG